MPADTQKGKVTVNFENGNRLEVDYDNKLGQGSFGAVYSGRLIGAGGEVIDENCAVKVPIEETDDLDEKAKLQKEIEISKKMGSMYEHENIDGTTYIVMPNLGKPLPNTLPPGGKLSETIKIEYSDSIDSDFEQQFETKSSNPSNDSPADAFVFDSGGFVVKDDSAVSENSSISGGIREVETDFDSGGIVVKEADNGQDDVTDFMKHFKKESENPVEVDSISGGIREVETDFDSGGIVVKEADNSQDDVPDFMKYFKKESENPGEVDSISGGIREVETDFDSGGIVVKEADTSQDDVPAFMKQFKKEPESPGEVDSISGGIREVETDFDSGGIIVKEAETSQDDAPDFMKQVKKPAETPSIQADKVGLKSPLDVERPELRELDCNLENFGAVDLEDTLDIFKKMAQEVKRAHDNGILHLDIKGENFLHNRETGAVKLIDFGESVYIDDQTEKFLCGSPVFVPPELMVTNPEGHFSAEQDTYSLGKTFVSSLYYPLQELNEDATVEAFPINRYQINPEVRFFMGGGVPQIANVTFKNPDGNPEIEVLNDLIDVMKDMTEVNPEKRPKMDTIIQRLEAIEQKHKNILEQEQMMSQAFENIEFKGNKMGDRYLAQRAIDSFNQEQKREWQRTPPDQRGPEPNKIEMPNNKQLDTFVEYFREYQKHLQEQEQQKKEEVELGPSQASSPVIQEVQQQKKEDVQPDPSEPPPPPIPDEQEVQPDHTDQATSSYEVEISASDIEPPNIETPELQTPPNPPPLQAQDALSQGPSNLSAEAVVDQVFKQSASTGFTTGFSSVRNDTAEKRQPLSMKSFQSTTSNSQGSDLSFNSAGTDYDPMPIEVSSEEDSLSDSYDDAGPSAKDNLNEIVSTMITDLSAHMVKTREKMDKQQGIFKGMMVGYQGDKERLLQLDAKLITELHQFKNDPSATANDLEGLLEQRMQDQRDINRGHIGAKTSHSDFHKTCEKGLNEVKQLQQQDQQPSRRIGKSQ